MTRLRFAVGAIALAFSFLPAAATAQVYPPPTTRLSDGSGVLSEAAYQYCLVSSVWAPCPAGSGGDASAANQTSQITQETLFNTRLGDITTPAAGTVNARLGQVLTALGTPFQAGGSIANTAFGISGTLPAFAVNPTVRIDQTAGRASIRAIASAQSVGTSKASSMNSVGARSHQI